MPVGIMNQDVRFTRLMTGQVAGTADVNGDSCDMAEDGGYNGVVFIASIGALSGGQATSLKAQCSSDDDDADAWADIEDSDSGDMADTDSGQCIVLDILNPPERYLRPVLLRHTANAVVDGIIAIQYRGNTKPSTHDVATIFSSEALVNPIEGTA